MKYLSLDNRASVRYLNLKPLVAIENVRYIIHQKAIQGEVKCVQVSKKVC